MNPDDEKPPAHARARGPAAGSAVSGYLQGLLAPWKGLQYMMANPGLFRYAVIPFFLNLAITIGVLVLLAVGGYRLYTYLHAGWGTGWLGGGRMDCCWRWC